MADSVKRQTMANNKPFQDRCEYYFYEHARTILEASTPDADDLSFSKAIWAGQVRVVDMTKSVITNATIGTAIDSDSTITEADIVYVVTTENKFNALAQSYSAAGLIT